MPLKKIKSKGTSIFIFNLYHFCLARELEWRKHLLVSLASLNLSHICWEGFLMLQYLHRTIFKTASKKPVQCIFQISYSNTYVGVPQSFPDKICQFPKTQNQSTPPKPWATPPNPIILQSWILEGRFYATPKTG